MPDVSGTRRYGVPLRFAGIGDSTFFQDGNGAANLTARLTPLGWAAGNLFHYARSGKSIAGADDQGFTTLQNMAQARGALGGEPDVWMFNLGSNGHTSSASQQATWVNAVLDDVAAAGGARTLWVGISQQNGYDGGANGTEATRLAWNQIVGPLVERRSFAHWLDWHAWIKAYPGEDALWSGGVHMTATGYGVKSDYYAQQIGVGRQ